MQLSHDLLSWFNLKQMIMLIEATVRRRRLSFRDFTIFEAALENLSAENFGWELLGGNRSGHSEQFRQGTLQESCREGGKGACQVTQFPSNSEGKFS